MRSELKLLQSKSFSFIIAGSIRSIAVHVFREDLWIWMNLLASTGSIY